MSATAEEQFEARLASHSLEFPPMPEAALRLQRVLDEPRHSTRQLVEALASDPAISAAVLRIANSAGFARGGAVANLATAVTRVGERELSRLVMAAGVGALAHKPGPLAAVRRRLAQDSLGSALVCERLAHAAKVPAEPLFLAGLLHDVGSLVALATLEKLLPASGAAAPRSAEAWIALAQTHHVELGTALGALWNLPPVVCVVIEHHHDPEGPFDEVTHLVQTADAVLALMKFGIVPTEERVPWLGRLSPVTRELLLESLAEVPGLLAAFEGDLTPPPSPAVLPEPAIGHVGAPLATPSPATVPTHATPTVSATSTVPLGGVPPRPAPASRTPAGGSPTAAPRTGAASPTTGTPAASPAHATHVPGPSAPVKLTGGRSGTAVVTSASSFALYLSAPIPEHTCAQLRLELPGGPLDAWIRVASCATERIGGEWLASARLFAPTKAVSARLASLFAEFTPRAA